MTPSTEKALPATGIGFLGGAELRGSGAAFRAVDPATAAPVGPEFTSCGADDVARAADSARAAYDANRSLPEGWQAVLLRGIAERLEAVRDSIVGAASAETGIGEGRLDGELARTRNQLNGFARVVEEGDYREALRVEAAPDAVPPRPDLRRVLVPVGPVAVFGASNFPLAFSTAGGDTASALAAGCPVLVKAHPSHPATSEIVGRAVVDAVAAAGAHRGTFALLHGAGNETGAALVTAPEVRAVGFTGSFAGGRALAELAAARPRPIPVFAEMGSLNPVFVTEAAVRERLDEIAEGFAASMTVGAGQMCTKPGLVFTTRGREFAERAATHLDDAEPGVLLNAATRDALADRLAASTDAAGVEVVTKRRDAFEGPGLRAAPVLLLAGLDDLAAAPELREEHFGPVAVVVDVGSEERFFEAVRLMPGSLTATVHAEPEDHAGLAPFTAELADLAGRVVHNGFPTGVAVNAAQTHGGPYPATSDSAHTSVGWTAVRRFQRPVTFQDVPEALLPGALRGT
ncbi:aldehyde dehydrogenase family protein [Streptomonospora alba]|uniref:aldehyde dehydrogenase family protein n=1 Tax=Streptomonospora alba TaxID=183763 RepID=UPI00069C46EE|nr:aldehyde dehydrogenase family protein [Streptomonospora alba]